MITRYWVMPTQWTFAMKPVKDLLAKYNVGEGWADPFAGLHSPAQFTNDIEESRGSKSVQDGLEFLKSIGDHSLQGVVFDPPYSVEQCLRCYTPKFKGAAGRTEYRAKCKDEIQRIVMPGGTSICFGWDTTGIGKGRGFEIVEILVLCHGASHNDTLVTVERRK